jgi:hypothetical protein
MSAASKDGKYRGTAQRGTKIVTGSTSATTAGKGTGKYGGIGKKGK